MPDLDLISRINYGTVFAVLILPAWTAFRLRSGRLSIPIGGIIFWAWLVLAGELLREADPSRDSLGPAFNFLFGLPCGIGYCSVWFLIGKLRKPRKQGRVSSAFGVVCWLVVALVCVCFPFVVSLKYHRSVAFYLPYTALGVGPLLALSAAMVITLLRQWPGLDRGFPERREGSLVST